MPSDEEQLHVIYTDCIMSMINKFINIYISLTQLPIVLHKLFTKIQSENIYSIFK